jgi:NADP-dependent aldehyde dehydrogenase
MTSVVSVDARTGETRTVGDETSADAVGAATTAAARAQRWLGSMRRDQRAELLDVIAAALEGRGDEIVATADRETALGEPRLRGELARTCFQLRFFGDVIRDGGYLEATIDHADPDALPAPRPDLRRWLVPIGPVAVFGASNFPLAFSVPGGDTASALAVGCPVIVKAHPAHPETSRLCGEAITEALASSGAPDGVFSVVYGQEAGTVLVLDPRISAVGFTGSLAGGRHLFDLAAGRAEPIPFYGELGSVNPLVVTRAAAAARGTEIGDGLAASVQLGLGQFCTKPGLAFVPAGPDGDTVVDALTKAATVSGHLLTAGIRDAFRAGVAEIRQAGATVLHDGDGDDALAGPVVAETSTARLGGPTAGVLLAERFGPFVLVARYEGDGDLSSALAAVPPALTATVHAEPDDPEAAGLLDIVAQRAGRVIVNGYPTGVAVAWAMHHGGPYPATTAPHTSVGAAAIKRWLRPVAYQSVPQQLLPDELRDEPRENLLAQRVDGRLIVP